MDNKNIRELRELQNLFADPKTCRMAWKAIGNAILRNPAAKPIVEYDKNGEETLNSALQKYTYDKLSKDIEELAHEQRAPTEIEMILACQIQRARTDTSAAIFVRDTLGAKPVDESKVDTTVNNFEQLTDEELALLAKHRERNKEKVKQSAILLRP